METSERLADPLLEPLNVKIKLEEELSSAFSPFPTMCQTSGRAREPAAETSERPVDASLKPQELKIKLEEELPPAFSHLPTMFVDCGGTVQTAGAVPCQSAATSGTFGSSHQLASTSSTTSNKKRPHSPNENWNYGSESESCESDDEEGAAPLVIPRVYRIAYLDDADDVFNTPEKSFAELPEDVTAYKPIYMYDFQWESFPDPPIPPQLRREIFSNINGPTSPCVDPYDNFTAIWDRKIMEHIASETNRYAQAWALQMFENATLKPTSRICDWQDTTADELYVYFALLLAMGMVVKGHLVEYWSGNLDIFCTPGFTAYMSLRRFQLINRYLHFNNNENMCAEELDASEAKLFKIKPVLTYLNRKFQTLYKLGQNIALDESLLQWIDYLNINQFNPIKAAAVGIKSYEICESQTGYLWRFEIHSYKSSPQPHSQLDPMNASIPSIVLKLIQGLENKGHTLWMDNFYNSPALARKLKSIGFDCVGTLRTNRQFVPEPLTNLTKSHMRPGQITGFTSGDVDVTVWRDRNRVGMISTYHGKSIIADSGSSKPILIHDYNIMMGGVDKKDQMLAMYPVERKRTKVWYKNLFRRLLNVSVLNAFILTKQSSSTITHRSFRHTLVKQLLDKHVTSSLIVSVQPKSQLYEAKKHYLAENQFLPSQKCRLRRQCVICKKRCQTFCAGCNKPVCISPCFVSLH